MVPACKGNTKMLNCKIYLRQFFAKLPTYLHKFACIPHKYRHFRKFFTYIETTFYLHITTFYLHQNIPIT